jgi:hypothetical protein
MEFCDNVKLEMIKTALACFTLGLGWFVGQRIITYWDIKKKRQELDIAVARQFHKLYGEFKELSRLWRAFTFTGERTQPLVFPEATRVDLLKRATASEGGVEAIVVKLATERDLTDDDIKTLGIFRQVYQQLRKAIRNGEPLESTYGTSAYTLFNDLASKMTCIISSSKTKMCPTAKAPGIMRRITAIRSEEWKEAQDRQALPREGNGAS